MDSHPQHSGGDQALEAIRSLGLVLSGTIADFPEAVTAPVLSDTGTRGMSGQWASIARIMDWARDLTGQLRRQDRSGDRVEALVLQITDIRRIAIAERPAHAALGFEHPSVVCSSMTSLPSSLRRRARATGAF